MTKKWLSDEEQVLWRSYLDVTRMLFRELDRQLLRDAGISFADYEILVLLSEAPDTRMRMSDLADASTTTRSGITRAISRMENAGWVRRTGCKSDKRGAWAELSAKGSSVLADASPGHVAAVREGMFDALTPEEVTAMGNAFTEMRTRLLERRRPS
ncbi:MarR family winged helix-turn-helix transcriptional regulator [Rhodococcus coprophilus]|uniref:MarR family transcriptional regulator n=1 Tax=Rhodococcus coprophilus TaxID=38310 RepID=A0A2X4WXV8_9NOCA|nr:MarR family transcriptional regulator [Rhodococcus coprophilus]MBM7461162.1 DNA-binding MarR family transcriptional regulator [Rhodococcus coprophilus]SQI28964.1 MarR family transcriptional regulator [Rhodococcus coprophilus]